VKLAALIGVTLTAVYAQEFEVASIRPAPPQNGARIRVEMSGGPGTSDPERFSCRCSLLMLVMEAYDVKYFQVVGLGSRGGGIYDVAVKVQPGTTKERFRVMLQKFLADRFHMELHRDVREMQGYDLIVAKSGPKMRWAPDEGTLARTVQVPPTASSDISLDRDGFPILPPGKAGMLSLNGRARMQGVGDTMDQLAAKIEHQLDLPVVNSTGLSGKYDFSLYWAGEPAPGGDSSGPSIFSAVESDLGLKLVPKKASVPVIMIDHVDSGPSGN
jgi:uncharacterized protein (TIGR03435 family)